LLSESIYYQGTIRIVRLYPLPGQQLSFFQEYDPDENPAGTPGHTGGIGRNHCNTVESWVQEAAARTPWSQTAAKCCTGGYRFKPGHPLKKGFSGSIGS